MQKIKYFIIIALIGCGTQYEFAAGKIDEAFLEHVDSFQKACNVKIESIEIQFGETQTEESPNTVGYCEIARKKVVTATSERIIIKRKIVISEFYWEMAPPEYRQLLIWHELGHCILLREHENHVDDHGKPKSIMNEFLSASIAGAFEKNPQKYTDELCRGK